MLSGLCILAGLAGAMAFPKIEHRAESAPSGNEFSKYYERFQDYVKGNQALNKPESPISQGQIQSDSQYNGGMPDFSQYQNQLQGYGNSQQSQQQYSEYFKKCMSSYNLPQMPTQGEANAASPSSGGYNQQWDSAWKACSQNFNNIPGASSFTSAFPGGSSATSG